MADHPRLARRLLLGGLLAAGQAVPAAAQGVPAGDAPRGPLAVPTLLRGSGQQVLRAGINLDGTATAFWDPFGVASGMAVRIGQILADGLEVRLTLVGTDPLYSVDDLRQGRFDVLLNAPPLMIEVAREILYADPYAHMDLVVVGRRAMDLPSVAALAGKRIGIQAGRTERLVAARLPPAIAEQAQSFANLDALADAIRRDMVDLLVVTSPVADRLIGGQATFQVKLTLGELWVGPACRFGEHDLLRAVNTVLYVSRQEGLLQVLHQEFYDRPLPRPPFF